ncbi:MAG TPA: NUDIX domain-containing protein [Candidatus Saccharimonadales bacterium]|jgi:8-oxo-dGTP pyrophosphatase MutT (NUDIX family)|nr:NUDIX domain-containing protein [Candidatus Saccharimonadales bacterium]
MPHLHTQPGQHDHTVSIYLFRIDLDEPKVLLHMHRKLASYMPFGGHIELDETPWQTIVHELKEESGYDINQVQLLQPHSRLHTLTNTSVHPIPFTYNTHPVPDNHFHTDSGHVVITRELPHQPPASGESTDLRLFTRAEIEAIPTDELFQDVREIIAYLFDNILDTWQPVSPNQFG